MLRKQNPHGENIVPKEGQRGVLRSSNNVSRCPSLEFTYAPMPKGAIDKVFDILFDALIETSKNDEPKKTNSDIRESVEFKPRE
jgi:hypothetical protein